jgi:hypothetical protein
VPFYIRKSVSAGPFRFHFSKGGVGVSVGIKGLRIGTGPRGHYIHAGRGGLYYRATLGKAGRSRPSAAERPLSPSPQMTFDDGDVPMTEIESGDVMHMQDESFTELLNEINSKAGQIRMSAALAWTGGVFGLLAGLAIGGPGLFLCILALPGRAIGKWLDSYRRSTVLYYDLEGDAQRAYSLPRSGSRRGSDCPQRAWRRQSGRFLAVSLQRPMKSAGMIRVNMGEDDIIDVIHLVTGSLDVGHEFAERWPEIGTGARIDQYQSIAIVDQEGVDGGWYELRQKGIQADPRVQGVSAL